MFPRPVDENNKMSQIVNEFASIFQTISVFLNENQFEESFPVLKDILQKMNFVSDMYGSSKELHDLEKTFSTNLTNIRVTFEAFASKEPFNYAEFYKYILIYQDEVTSQYLKITILDLYHNSIYKDQSFVSLEEMKVKLSSAILSLKRFFYNINQNSTILNNILTGLEGLQNVADNELTKYLINLAGIIDQTISTEKLSGPTKKAVSEAMNVQLNRLKRKFELFIPVNNIQESFKQTEYFQTQSYSEKKENQQENTQNKMFDSGYEEPAQKKQKINSISLRDEENFTDSKSLFFELLAYSAKNNILSQEHIAKLLITIDNILIIYRHTPQYFINLPQAMLESAKILERKKEESILPNSAISMVNEIEKCYQEMIRRCFQLQICDAYNNLTDNSNSDADWQEGIPLVSVIKTLEYIQTRMEIEVDKKKIEDVIQGFKKIEYPLIKQNGYLFNLAKCCIVALDKLFKQKPEITQFYPQYLSKIIDTIKKMQEKLTTIVTKGFDDGNRILTYQTIHLFLEQLGKMEIKYTLKNSMDKELRAKAIATHLYPELMTPNAVSEKVSVQGNRVTFTREINKSNLANILNPETTHFYNGPLPLFQSMTLEKIAKEKGFDCIELPASDLYSTIAFQIQNLYPQYANAELSFLAEDLRQATHAELEKNQHEYNHLVVDEMVNDNNKNPYLKDHPYIAALCNVLKTRIVVLHDQGNLPPLVFGRPDVVNVICLGHEKQNNYQALIPLRSTDNAIERLISASVPLYYSDDTKKSILFPQ